MSVKQIVWSLDTKQPLEESELKNEKELEDLIYEHIDIIDPNLLVIGRQIQTDGGPLDILCIDSDCNTVVIELKKGMTPREVTAQALDYASCISQMSFEELSLKCLDRNVNLAAAFKQRFKEDIDPDGESGFNQSTRIIIVASKMDPSTQRIVEYLIRQNIDINVLFFTVFQSKGERYISRAWMVDDDDTRRMTKTHLPWNGEYYCAFNECENRSWDDAMDFGFYSAIGKYANMVYGFKPGDRIWLHLLKNGYCGCGIVQGYPMPADKAKLTVDGKEYDFLSIPGLRATYHRDEPDRIEQIVPVKWIHKQKPVGVWETGFFSNQRAICTPETEKWDFTVKTLKARWNIQGR